MVVGIATPAARILSVVRILEGSDGGVDLLTGTVVDTVRDDRRGSVGATAGLVGAVTDAVGEGGVAAEASSHIGGTTDTAEATG